MRITRLAIGMVVICGMAVPASGATSAAATASVPTSSVTPTTISPGQPITAAVTDCDPPEGGAGFIETGLVFDGVRVDLPPVPGEPGTYRGTFGTDLDAPPGLYPVFFYCGEEQIWPPLAVTLVGPAPTFTATLTPHTFGPGQSLTLATTGCHSQPFVSDADGLFAARLALHQSGAVRWWTRAVTKSRLSYTKKYRVFVRCRGIERQLTVQPSRNTTMPPGGWTGARPGGQTLGKPS